MKQDAQVTNFQYEIRVFGRVQGVGFRYSARNQARVLGLKGWVENRMDGSVRSVIQGKREDCLKYMDWCRRGTGYAWVEKVDIKEMEAEELTSFQVRY
jgi:acylphosphatase